MPGRYQPNTANAQASFPVYPKGDHEFKILSFKANKKVVEKNQVQEEVVTMQVNVECVNSDDRTFVGKKNSLFFTLSDPNLLGFFKQFMMAAYDYPISDDSEKLFNEQILSTKDDGFNEDGSDLGSYYTDAVGLHLIGASELTTGKKGTKYEGIPQNQWRWRGLSASVVTA